MDKIKILYLEDNPLDVKVLNNYLESEKIEFQMEHALDELEFRTKLERDRFDLIIADYYLPSYDGFRALAYVAENHPAIPVILISGVAGEEIAVDAIKRGASDYLLKSNLSRIIPAIRQALLLASERMQKALAEDLKSKYDFIINTSRSFMSLINRNYTYEAINNAFAAAHNLIREEVIGKRLWEIWGEKSFRDVIKPNLDRSFSDNEVRYQAWFEIPRQGRRFFEVTFYPFKNRRGEVTHTVVDTFDITERKLTEDALRESEEKYRTLVDQAQDGICILKEGKILFANPIVFRLSGYSEKEMIGKQFWNFIQPVERKRVREIYRKRMAGMEMDAKYDSVVVRKNGSLLDVEMNAAVIRYAGEPAELVVIRDISARKETERKIHEHALDLTLINDLNTGINRGEKLETILETLWARTEQVFDSLGAAIYFLSEDKRELVLQINASSGKSIRKAEKFTGIDLNYINIPFSEDSFYWNTFKKRKPFYTEDRKTIVRLIGEHGVARGMKKLIPGVIKMLGIKSILNIPLFSGKEPLGILIVARKYAFSRNDIDRLLSFSTQITSLLKRKATEEENLHHLEDQSLINELNHAVNSGESLFRILKILSDRTRKMFSGYGASVYLISDDRKFLLPTMFSLPTGMIKRMEKMLGENLSSIRVKLEEGSMFLSDIRVGKPVVYQSPESIRRLIGEFAETKFQKRLINPVSRILNLKYLANIPLKAENESIGILNISKTVPFSGSDIRRLENIAIQVTSIIRRKMAEEELRETTDKFMTLFGTANDAIFLMEGNHFIDCNQRTLEMFSCRREEIIGRTPIQFSPGMQPDGKSSDESAREKIRAAFSGNTEQFEWVHKRLNGTLFHAEVSLNQLELKGKKYLQAIVRDISERKKSEKEIIRNEKGLREAQRIASVGSWEWDLQEKTVIWSDETYNILGLDKKNTITNLQSFLLSVHPEDKDMVKRNIDISLRERKPVDFFHRIIKPGGEERSVHSRAEVLLDSGNDPARFVGTIHDITDLRKAQKAFLESEEKFRAVFEKGQFAMVLSTPDERLTSVNQAAEQLFGYPADELLGMHFGDLTHPEDLTESKVLYQKLVRDEIPYFVVEKRYTRGDGRIIHCHTGVSSIQNEEGMTVNTVAMIVDITEKMIAEKQIKQRTEELALINTLNTLVNTGESLDKIFQYFANEVLKQFSCHLTVIALMTEDQEYLIVENVSMTPKIMKVLEKLVATTIRKHQVKPVPGGVLIQCLQSTQPQLLSSEESIYGFIREFATKETTLNLIPEIRKILDMNYVCTFPLRPGNEVVGMIVTARREEYDKTDIERMNHLFDQMVSIIIRKKVEEERIRLSTVVEQMGETVVITDTGGNLQYANPAFEKVSGYTREEAYSRNMRILQSGVQDKAFYEKLWNTITSGDVWHGKMVNKRKNGTLFQERATISPIRDEQGKIINYVAVKQDITRESQLETQLVQSQKLETVGTLARGIAHDFNNILGTILGYNDMALEEVLPENRVHDYLVQMKKASDRARALVNQILTFSRDVEPEKKSVMLQELLENSLDLFLPSIRDNIRISTRIDPECPPVIADPSQIQQVMINLFTNASYAMNEKGGTLTVSLDKVVSPGGTLTDTTPGIPEGEFIKLSVTDTGTGMDPEVKARIFEPFYSTKPVGEGTGLGLSLVHGIIQNHNGFIAVHSEPGEGTSFGIFLPL